MDSLKKIQPVFARHETFHPRFGWLKKGFDKACVDPQIFSRDDAPVTLGVGKNMVKAIRYWCKAYKILDDATGVFLPTPFGEALLGKDKWDPFLEDSGSLWLLHWNLLKPPSYATAWHLIFNGSRQMEFTQPDLLQTLSEGVQKDFPDHKINESSLNKDVNCLLRMYVRQSPNKMSEETLDCPFAELSLILHTGGNHYAFHSGQKPGLLPEIIVAACLEFAANQEEQTRTISIFRLLYEIGSPGLVFKLTESVLYHAIEQVSKKFTSIALSDTAGLIQFSFAENPETLANDILESYYHIRRN
ncbi:MAG: DUF4007 family protein [SAR324 cluster bacterium]|nr:DUF4007 family protein [SAR324 cluster bacterium]